LPAIADIVGADERGSLVFVTTTEQIEGVSHGSLTVKDGGVLVVLGEHDGSISVEGGGQLDVRGTVRGPITIDSLGRVNVSGQVDGYVLIRVAGTLVNEASGRISGGGKNFGSFTNHGSRVGSIEERQPDDRAGSTFGS
jgi:hypothetical protein